MRQHNSAPERDPCHYEYLPRSVAPGAIAAEAVSGLVALLVFVVTALLVSQHLTKSVDVTFFHTLLAVDTPLGVRFADALGVLGQDGIIVAAIFLGIVFAVRRCWPALTILVVVMVGAEVLDNFFKAIFARQRPTALPSLIAIQDYSFPSGHALESAAFFLFLAYLGWHIFGARQRVIWSVAMALLVIAISFSRLYLGVHYLSDVVAGAALGFFWSDTVILGQQILARRRVCQPSS